MVERIRVVGNKLRTLTATGEADVHLRGANIIRFAWKYQSGGSPHSDRMAALALAKMGSNCQTIWIDSNPVNEGNATYLEYVRAMVAASPYTVLSWHADNGQDEHPAHHTDAGRRAMRAMAREFANNPGVLYACHAEPGFSTNDAARWRELRDEQEAMIDAIRTESPDAVIGVAGSNWSQRIDWMLADPVRRPGIFVKPHIYQPMPDAITKMKLQEIAARWPVIVGELGEGERMSSKDCESLIGHAETQFNGWQAWNFSDLGKPTMVTDMEALTLNAWGTQVRAALASRSRLPDPPSPQAKVALAELSDRPPAPYVEHTSRSEIEAMLGETAHLRARIVAHDDLLRALAVKLREAADLIDPR